jgi:four helix bundle protein
MKFTSFTEMPVWQKAHRLVLEIYKLTASFPREEVYGLISQVRRSALSISGNIAEAFGRYHYLDKNRFYLNARGSLEETKNYLIISYDLEYIGAQIFQRMMDEINDISEDLNTLIKTLRIRNQQKLGPDSKSESESKSKSEFESESESKSESKSESEQ